MTVQAWVPLAVAAVGFIATLLNGAISGRNATRTAVRMREMDRRDARRDDYRGCCREFLAAALLLRLSITDGEASEISALRRAASDIGLHNPAVADGPVTEARDAVERLVRLRSDGAWSESITDAETACDRALSAVRAALSLASIFLGWFVSA